MMRPLCVFAAALLLGAAPTLAQTAAPVSASSQPPALLLPASELLGLATLEVTRDGYQLTPSGGETRTFPQNALYLNAKGEVLIPAALLREAGCLLYPTGNAVTVKCGRVSLGIVPAPALPAP